jgi:hypothetical protein
MIAGLLVLALLVGLLFIVWGRNTQSDGQFPPAPVPKETTFSTLMNSITLDQTPTVKQRSQQQLMDNSKYAGLIDGEATRYQ